MRRCVRLLRVFCRRDGGATAVEYTVLIALFLLMVVATVRTLGKNVGDTMSNTAQSITNARIRESGSADRTVHEERKAIH